MIASVNEHGSASLHLPEEPLPTRSSLSFLGPYHTYPAVWSVFSVSCKGIGSAFICLGPLSKNMSRKPTVRGAASCCIRVGRSIVSAAASVIRG